MIFDTDGPFVQGVAGAALHHLEVYFHIQVNVHLRKWADVKQSSFVGLLYKQFTPFCPAKTKKVSIIWHSFRFIHKTLHVDSLHIPVDVVGQIISPVVRSLKEAGEIKLCACEAFEILLILKERKICKQTGAHENIGNTTHHGQSILLYLDVFVHYYWIQLLSCCFDCVYRSLFCPDILKVNTCSIHLINDFKYLLLTLFRYVKSPVCVMNLGHQADHSPPVYEGNPPPGDTFHGWWMH